MTREEAIADIRDNIKPVAGGKSLDMAIEALEQQPKVGEWLEKEINNKVIEEWQSARCSICDKYHTTPYMYYFSHYEYCPHCGSKMEVSDAK